MGNLDKIHRFIFDDTDIRGEIISLNKSYNDATSNQALSKQCKILLGEFLAAVALISETLKFNGIITLQVRGDGPVNLAMAEVNFQGHLRGVIKLNEEIENANKNLALTAKKTNRCDTSENTLIDSLIENKTLNEIFGKGSLTITLDPEEGERYQGIVPIEGENLGDCLANYFLLSEQLPTQIILNVNEEISAGLLLQSLPAKTDNNENENNDDTWNTVTQLAATINADELFELDHETVLYRLFNNLNCRVFPSKTLSFKCSCTYERCANAISSIGRNEAFSLLEERDVIDINCEFCGKKYTFGNKQLEEIFSDESKPLH